MKADLYAMTASRTTKTVALKLNTSLCYNPDIERLTITIYDLEGLEVFFFFNILRIWHLNIVLSFTQILYQIFVKRIKGRNKTVLTVFT